MYKLIIVLVSLVVVSCKTTEDCGCYTHYIPLQDTIVSPEIHDHVIFNGEPYCIHVEEHTFVEEDTLWLECLNNKK